MLSTDSVKATGPSTERSIEQLLIPHPPIPVHNHFHTLLMNTHTRTDNNTGTIYRVFTYRRRYLI